MKYSSKRSHKKAIIIVTSIVALLVIAALVYFFVLGGKKISESTTNTTGATTTRSTNDVNYSGPSSDDTANSQNGKKNSADNSTNTTTQTNDVKVGVAFADISGSNFEVRAFTPSVIEGDGTCTAVLTKDGVTVQGSSLAFVDASSSQCRPIDIDLSKFISKGTWSLTVEYSSADHKGASDPQQVSI